MEGDQAYRNNLQEIKLAALSIREKIDSSDPADVQNAMKEYVSLFDRFYQVEENLAPHQYRAAKQDFEYFLRLLDLAIHHSSIILKK
jgi:hypothetical protein